MNLTEIELFQIMEESFQLLRNKPGLFLPKIFSTFVGALWFIGLIESLGSRMAYVASYPVMILLSVAVAYLVSALVKQEKEEGRISYKQGFRSMWSEKFQIILATLTLTLIILFISLPLTLGFLSYMLNFNALHLFIGAFTSFSLSIIFAIAIYFLPATLVSEKNVLASFVKSAHSANRHRKDVFLLTFFSFVLLLIASVSSDAGRTLGYAGFLAGRFISAIFSTYIYVVSPKYYFDS